MRTVRGDDAAPGCHLDGRRSQVSSLHQDRTVSSTLAAGTRSKLERACGDIFKTIPLPLFEELA